MRATCSALLFSTFLCLSNFSPAFPSTTHAGKITNFGFRHQRAKMRAMRARVQPSPSSPLATLLLGRPSASNVLVSRQIAGPLKINCDPLFPLRSSSARRYNTATSTLGTTSRSRPTHTEEARPKDRRPGGQDVKKSRSMQQRTGSNNAVEPKAEAKEVANATEKGTTRNVLPADGPYRLVERLAKRIARSGLCSRREAERLIEEVGTAFSLHHACSASRADLVVLGRSCCALLCPPGIGLGGWRDRQDARHQCHSCFSGDDQQQKGANHRHF